MDIDEIDHAEYSGVAGSVSLSRDSQERKSKQRSTWPKCYYYGKLGFACPNFTIPTSRNGAHR